MYEDLVWNDDDYKTFNENIDAIECRLSNDTFDMYKYAEFYCQQDVTILRLAFNLPSCSSRLFSSDVLSLRELLIFSNSDLSISDGINSSIILELRLLSLSLVIFNESNDCSISII